MKFKRILPFLVVVSLFFYAADVRAFSAELGVTAKKNVHTISPGLDYSSSVEIIDGHRQEIYTFTYTPGGETSILPAYGEYIYGFNSVGQLISSYNGEGRVVGGINTDFFITSTGIPLSCLISEGEIISSCDNRPAIGFDKSGNAVIGYPEIKASFISETTELQVAHINKTPAVWGMYLLTDEFYKSTRSSLDSIEIVFRPFEKTSEDITDFKDIEFTEKDEITTDDINEEEDIPDRTVPDASESTTEELNSTPSDSGIKENVEIPFDFSNFTFTDENIASSDEINVIITEIRKNSKNSDIPEGSFVLCVPAESFGYMVEGIDIGDEFVLTTEINDIFSGCVNVFGAGSIILEDGEFAEQTSDSIYKYKNPRTAAGIKDDGSVIFVAVDGRRAGKSEGFTAKELADYMKSLGCTDAVNFDGGGSTTFYAADIGEIFSSLKNTPSEGSERRVADGLIFVNTTKKAADIAHGALYPAEQLVYSSETTIDFSGEVLFADSNFHPIEVDSDDVTLSVDNEYGITYGNVFIPNGKEGNAAVTAIVKNQNGAELLSIGNIKITDKVNKLDISASHKEMSPFDKSSKLAVSAYLNTIPVVISPKNIEWNIYVEKETDSGNPVIIEAGAEYADVDYATMEFVPHIKGYKYIISASVGGFYETIEIFSDKMPYADMELHWAAKTAYYMHKSGYINGELHSDGNTYFMPDRNMTRVEFCVLLARVLSIEPLDDNQDENINDGIKDATLYIVNDFESEDQTDNFIEEQSAENIIAAENGDIETSNVSAAEFTPEYDFSDVPEWAKGYINALKNNGYLSELLIYSENGILTLRPDDYITRADVIRTLGSLLENVEISVKELDTLSEKYSDFVTEKENDALYFARITESGIINGYDDRTLRQNSNITRAEATAVFARFLNFNVE